jgi:hypothetical protein
MMSPTKSGERSRPGAQHSRDYSRVLAISGGLSIKVGDDVVCDQTQPAKNANED